MSKTVAEILAPKPDVRLRIYAYSINDAAHKGLLKVGQTTRDVKQRIAEQLKTAAITNYIIELDEPAERDDGTTFTDHAVRTALKNKGFTNPQLEWMECALTDVRTVLAELRSGQRFTGTHHETFKMRREQQEAVDLTANYFHSVWQEDTNTVPRFLWNAKMRFGKTFAAYHLAAKLNAKRVLVVTYKPAVEDAWQTDLKAHTDFSGWEFFSRASTIDPSVFAADTPLVCFSSLQDLRGRTPDGAIKEHNRWIHNLIWDLVIVDEYHYGAWNDATRELLAGEVGGGQAEFAAARGEDSEEDASKDLVERLDNIQSKAFLCLSGTPFRAIASNEFSEEHIFNWTYTDEQRAKAEFLVDNPGEQNPYRALPKMNLLVYELPENLRKVAIGSKRNEFDLSTFFAATGNGNAASFTHKDQVQSWLDWLRGQDVDAVLRVLDAGTAKPFPYSDTKILPYMNHSVWFLPNVASVYAMKNLLTDPQNVAGWGQFTVLPVAGTGAGVGTVAIEPVRKAIRNGSDTKTITLTCGKLLTGITVSQWSAILMLNNLEAPESYFQAAFRVQSPWSIKNPNGDDPNEEDILKPDCLVLDFAPNRALRLFTDYGMRLGDGRNADNDVRELARFLPVLGFDGTKMQTVDIDKIIDIAFQTTTIDTRQMHSKKFINPDASKLDLLSEEARRALNRVMRQRPSDSSTDTNEDKNVINETPELTEGDSNADAERSVPEAEQKDDLTEDDLEERLRFLAKRINAFMYLSDDVEKNLYDVLATGEVGLFCDVMQLRREDMTALVDAGLFNEQAMRLAIHQFRRADVDSFSYTGLNPRSCSESSKRNGDAKPTST